MSTLHDVMSAVVSERAERKGEKKHYIPFTGEEFNAVRTAFKRPAMTPNDLKLVIQAIVAGKLELTIVKPSAPSAAK